VFAGVLKKFGVTVPSDVELCRLQSRELLEAKCYPVATLVGQSLGSVLLALEAVCKTVPDVFVDTTGLAFTYPVAAGLCGARVAAYVHYPTISTDMISAVSERKPAFNNAAMWSTQYGALVKLAYYRLFAKAYSKAGACANVAMANGSWTRGHVQALWGGRVQLVYPPCGTMALEDAEYQNGALQKRKRVVVSLAQFRPEKDHALQLAAWALLPAAVRANAKLVIAGGVRNADDALIVAQLRKDCANRKLHDSVEFLISAPREAIADLLRTASVGLHTMRLEHFGIALVEMMACGVIPVAHASGGPLLDIVGESKTRGLLATDAESYAAALAKLLALSDEKLGEMRLTAAAHVRDRYADETFGKAFVAALAPLIQ